MFTSEIGGRPRCLTYDWIRSGTGKGGVKIRLRVGNGTMLVFIHKYYSVGVKVERIRRLYYNENGCG